MRRSALLLVLSLAACTRSSTFVVEGPPLDPVIVAPAGIATASAREAVARFLEAYARTGSDVGELADMVDGPHLKDWVHWLGVQNATFEERIDGRVRLRGLRIQEIRGGTATAALSAAVFFPPVSDGEQVLRVPPRSFETPVVLRHEPDDVSSWRVVDVNRDGRGMRATIALLNDAGVEAERDGIRVKVVSVYRFSLATAANIRIRNDTSQPIRVDIPHSLIQVRGQFLGAVAGTPGAKLPIAPGGMAEVALNFPPIAATDVPELLRVFFEGKPAPVVELPLPEEAFLLGSLELDVE